MKFRVVQVVPAILAAVFSSLVGSSQASAQSHVRLTANARLTGSTTKLLDFAEQVADAQCASRRCAFSIPKTLLNVNVPGEGRWRITLNRAKFSRFVSRYQNGRLLEDFDTRPVHFRGTASALGHAGKSSPVVVTVFRDFKERAIELALDRENPRRADAFGTLVVRFSSTASSKDGSLNARASRSSSTFLKQLQCGASPEALHSAAHLPSSALQSSASTDSPNTAAFNVIYLTTDFDPQFASTCGTGCNNEIETAVERAAAFYESQFTFTLQIKNQFGPNGSLGSSTNSSTALEVFRQYNNNNRSGVPTDIFTLFTGRTMQSSVIGLAYVGVTCSALSYSSLLVQRVSGFTQLVLAHEIGHTFDAQHTASGIMGASLDPSNPPTSFSSTSVSQISSYFTSNYPGTCLGGSSNGGTNTPTPTPTRTPTRTPTPIPPVDATPTPTSPVPATPTPGKGGGNGSTPGDITPETLGLRAAITAKGIVSITSTVSQVLDGCVVQLRAGATEDKAVFGTLIAEFTPVALSSTLTATVPFHVNKTKRGGENVYVMARFYCPQSDDVVEQSRVIRFAPNKKVRNKRALSKQSFINRLAKNLE